MTTTPRPPIQPPASPPSDTVQWNDRVTAPVIIPITAAVVFACIILLLFIRCFKTLWDKKKRSDTYEITDLIKEKDSLRADIPVLDQSHDLDAPDHPNLNLVNYSGEKRFHRRSLDIDLESGRSSSQSHENSGNGMIRIEANVHDSSNENNDFDDLEEHEPQPEDHMLPQNHNFVLHSNHSSPAPPVIVGLEEKVHRHQNSAPLAPTESEV